jgi:hypothetical protein
MPRQSNDEFDAFVESNNSTTPAAFGSLVYGALGAVASAPPICTSPSSFFPLPEGYRLIFLLCRHVYQCLWDAP